MFGEKSQKLRMRQPQIPTMGFGRPRRPGFGARKGVMILAWVKRFFRENHHSRDSLLLTNQNQLGQSRPCTDLTF